MVSSGITQLPQELLNALNAIAQGNEVAAAAAAGGAVEQPAQAMAPNVEPNAGDSRVVS